MRVLRIPLILILMFSMYSLLMAQGITPDPSQVYRFIKISSNENATDTRWIEIWERRDGQDREWVMIDSESDPISGIESTCYYALAIGGGVPLYLVDDEVLPTGNAQELFDEIENRRLVDNAENYVTNLDCASEQSDTINGIQSDLCTFEEDAFGLFLVRPPATATGDLWLASDGDYVVDYDFRAQGPLTTVEHRYDFIPPDNNFAIEPQQVDSMLCFDNSFPVPDDTQLLTGNTTFSAYASPLRMDELQTFYDLELIPDWEAGGATPGGGRVFRRTLDSGTQCTLSLRFGDGQNDTTTIAASVFPESVNVESLELPDDFSSPVVVQSVYSLPVISFLGTVTDAVSNFTSDYETQGWSLRDDLTDIRDESAFIVLTQDEQEMYITINNTTKERSSVLIQTRAGICGPTFDMP
ncbi:MAG: hypothetical protein Phog2KO_30280 [Phototrophicaceae bacterium]